MSSQNPRFSKFVSISLLGATLGFALSGCNKPPSRSFLVKIGSDNAEPEVGSPSHNNDETEDDETPENTGEMTTGEPSTETGTETDKPMTGEMTTGGTDKPTTDTGMTDTGDKPSTGEPTTQEPKKLVECTNKLSVGRIHQWHATNEGTMIPQDGLIVVKDGDHNVAKVEFVGEGWHVVPVWLKNAYEAEVDLSKSKNFTITYSATAELYVQLRPSFAWSGGDKWAAKLPSTNGQSKTLVVSFEDAAMWTAPLGQPPHTLNEARAKARGFVFVGNKPTKFAVTSLLIDGYEPPCE